jgi:hypothetical protein
MPFADSAGKFSWYGPSGTMLSCLRMMPGVGCLASRVLDQWCGGCHEETPVFYGLYHGSTRTQKLTNK